MARKLNIVYDENRIQNDIVDAIKKKEFYYTNNAIKLNGDEDLNSLYEEIIETINLTNKVKKY